MKRLITEKLRQWQNKPNRKPLIVRGARQVGKTYIIRQFGRKHFPGKFHEINLEKHPDWHPVFKTNFDVKPILSEIGILLNETINTATDLLFFDEIQECPEAITALRYFYEEMPELHIIAAGSLLEFALQDIPFPVGRVELLNMYPLNFYEFLLANNQNQLAEIVRKNNLQVSTVVHNQLRATLKQYFFVGGMPECVAHFRKTQQYKEVQNIQTNLLNTFRQDFLKYSPKVNTHCLAQVLASTSQQIGQQVKYSKLSDGFSNPTIKKAFDLLTTAKILTRVSATSPTGLPLAAQVNNKIFKAIFLDIGLLVRLSGLAIEHEYQKTDLLASFRGMLAEQFVGQEIRSFDYELYYWHRSAKSSTAETDYLIVLNDEIIPIEVKSGSKGRLRSLHLLMKEHENIKKAFVFLDTPYKDQPDENIRFLPLYAVSGFIKPL